ncbi:MAG: OmpA family protein [Halioglobus sp.]|nr:OmpA family protein [Halioglobus sp.]
MNKRLISATAAACIALAGLSAPTSAELPVTINAGAGYWFFDHEVFGLEPEDGGTPYIGLEYALNDNWAADFLFADDETDFDGTGIDTDITTWQLGLKHYFGSGDRRFLPFVGFGAGEIEFEADQFDTVETTLNAGAGVRYMFGERISVSLESRAIYSVDESDTDVLVMAGLNFWLGDTGRGASSADDDGASAYGAGAAGSGDSGMDSDGDGVGDGQDRCPNTPPGTRVDLDGCELPVVQVASVKLMVNFATDSTVVGPQYFADLTELAEFLGRFQDLEVDVEGHTDSVGAESYNQGLSQRRAQAVVDLLVNEHGIARERLQAKGYGETRPVASNDTPEGRAQNRRVMATLEVEYEE